MPSSRSTRELTCSILLVRSFLKVLDGHPAIAREPIAPLLAYKPDRCLPLWELLELLKGAIELTGDEDLGLEAAEAASLGDYDVLEYAVASCTTALDALEVLNRYIPLLNDADEFSQDVREGKVYGWMRSRMPLSRAAADFRAASLYRKGAR